LSEDAAAELTHPAGGFVDVFSIVGPAVGRASGASIEALLEERRTHGVATSLVHSRPALLGDARSGNRALLDRIAGEPGLLPLAVLAPERSGTADIDAIAAHIAGWWLAPQFPVGDSVAMDDVLAAAARHGKPIFAAVARFGDASRIARATAGLGVPVVLVGTHYGNAVDVLAAARRFGHVVIETSSMAHYGAIATAVALIGAERILLGTGSPMRAAQSSLNAIAVAQIPDDAKRAIAGGNAARLFGLDPGTVPVPEIRRPARAIDVHAHLGPLGFDVPEPDDAAFAAELARQMNTTIAIASAVEAIETDLDAGNRRMIATIRAQPSIRGHLTAYPDDVEGTREQIRRYGAEPGVIGVKIGCEQSQHTASRAVWDVFDVLADYGRPVKIHNDGPGWAEALLGIARAHPALPIIVAHGGLGTPSPEGAWLTEEADNIYLEMCSSFANLTTVREVARRVPAHKFLFGSDAPLLEPAFILGTYQDAGIPPANEAAVYWDNAARLFGIS